MRVEIVPQGGRDGLSLAAAIKQDCENPLHDRFDAAVAYATAQGVRALDRLLGRTVVQSRWVLGLDDAITQSAAIDMLQQRAGAEVRVVKLSPARRFHPKYYRLWSSTDATRSVTIIGSGNMTERGLQSNAEAAVILRSDTAVDSVATADAFHQFWHLGHTPQHDELERYRVAEQLAAAARRKSAERRDSPGDPSPDQDATEAIPVLRTSENVIARAVCLIAANQFSGICSFEDARRLVPRMVALTPGDLARSNSQQNAKWIQLLRNIQSNSRGGTNYIASGYLEHVPGIGYRITPAGRALLAI